VNSCDSLKSSYRGTCSIQIESNSKTLSASDFDGDCKAARSTLTRLQKAFSGPSTASPAPPPAPSQPSATPSVAGATPSHTGFAGTIYSPNGTDPVPEALVYLPKALNPGIVVHAMGNDAEGCGEPTEEYVAKTCTDAKGRFSFTLGGSGFFKFIAKKGRYSQISNVDVKQGQLALAPAIFPNADSATGTSARFAVVRGAWDALEKILGKMGVAKYVDVPSVEDLASMSFDRFDVVLINCSDHSLSAKAGQWLSKYVSSGGRVYITDRAAPIVTNYFSNEFRTIGAKSVSGTVKADIRDLKLASWLQTVQCEGGRCENGQSVGITGFMEDWKQITHMPANATVLMSSNGVPLTIMFPFGKGVVFYSSYHTYHAGSPEAIYPQERVLQYFLLKIL
jgi:hypothetical protein